MTHISGDVMKKIIIITFLILMTSFSLHAGKLTNIGMKIGYNSSTFGGKNLPGKGVSNVPGFTLGGFASYELSKKFSVQPEILLTTKGSRINTVGDIEQYNIFVYVEMPILAKYRLLQSGNFYLRGLCGPGFSLKALAMNDVGVLDNIRGIDCGLIAGAEVGLGRFSFELRYEFGLLNFDTSIDDADLKNKSISFLFGIAFVHQGSNS